MFIQQGMRISIIIISVFYIISCDTEKDNNKYFWLSFSINKDLNYDNITVNNIKESEDQKMEYLEDKGISIEYWRSSFEQYNMIFLKFSSMMKINDLKNYKIEIKNNDNIIWTGFAYNENDFSECGFYQMKDEPNKDKIRDISFYFIEKDEDNKLVLGSNYYIGKNNSSLCEEDSKQNEVMISVNIANNVFDNDYIVKINDINVDNGIENNYIWHNFRELLEKSGLSSLYHYCENQDGFGKSSSYWNLMIDRGNLKNYSLEFLFKSGKKTVKNLSEIEFCAVPDEKNFNELISEFKVLTYGFTVKNGDVKIEFKGALNNNNRMVNCSKESGTTSGIVFSPLGLLKDRNGNINITKYDKENTNYSFTNNWVSLYYNNISGDPYEYRKFGLKRWSINIYTHYTVNTDDGFYMSIPWHLVKEGESLTITSDMIDEQSENEKTFWKSLLHPLYYSHETGISFSNQGSPIVNYGNYQEITYYFNKIPKKYGDFLEFNFHVIAKEDEEVVLDYEGSINSRYFGEDIFSCFNSDKLWVCSAK